VAFRRDGSLFCCFWQVRILGNWDQCSTDIASADWRYVLALVRVSEDVLIQGPSEAWMGSARVLAPIGSELGVGCWELHRAGAVVVSTAGSSLPEPGLTSLKTVTCFGVVASAAVSNVHRGTWGTYEMACDCCH